jgi:hypothetical protein
MSSGLLLVLTVARAEATNRIQVTDSSNEITVIYKFDKPKVAKKEGIDHSVSVEGLPSHGTPGAPVLPVKTGKILLPEGYTVKDIQVTPLTVVHVGDNFFIEYGIEPVVDEREFVDSGPNPEIYDSAAPFPAKIFKTVSVQRLHGYDILLINIYPVQYIPKTGSLYYFKEVKVRVLVEKKVRAYGYQFERPRKRELKINERKRLEDQTDNYQTMNRVLSATTTLSQYVYVVITNDELRNAFQRLVDFKKTRHANPITATIKTTEEIYADYPGSDNQEKIRNFIIDAYNNWGTEYVLLGGDVEIVPHRGMYVHREGVYEEVDKDIPCDMYYACLDGNWNHDADDLFGEPNDGTGGGEVDLFAEVFVGRAPVETLEETTNFIDKTIAHETETDEDRLRRAVLVGQIYTLESEGPPPLVWKCVGAS